MAALLTITKDGFTVKVTHGYTFYKHFYKNPFNIQVKELKLRKTNYDTGKRSTNNDKKVNLKQVLVRK